MSQFNSINPLDPSAQRAPVNGFNALRSEDFIRIIFTELSNQDPFQPSDSSALLEQLNSIRSIESDIDLMERLDDLVFQNQLAGAANLIGKFVEGLSETFGAASGTVRTVSREGEHILLELDSGERMPLENVLNIHDGAPGAVPPP
jgi:flagellar basal-body rod modification protein FlgD